MNSTQPLRNLVDDVEELLAALNSQHQPNIAELRDRVEDTIESTKQSLDKQRKSATARIGRYAASVDDYITGYPRLGFATGLLVGGILVYLAGRLSPGD